MCLTTLTIKADFVELVEGTIGMAFVQFDV
jgi:hypothetical protein